MVESYIGIGMDYVNSLFHYGVDGPRDGVCREENLDTTITPKGEEQYDIGDPRNQTEAEKNAKEKNDKEYDEIGKKYSYDVKRCLYLLNNQDTQLSKNDKKLLDRVSKNKNLRAYIIAQQIMNLDNHIEGIEKDERYKYYAMAKLSDSNYFYKPYYKIPKSALGGLEEKDVDKYWQDFEGKKEELKNEENTKYLKHYGVQGQQYD